MLRNYFKTAWRNLFKNKTFSLINISGLTIGMAGTMLIVLWVYNERSWDHFHKNFDNVHHVMSNRNFNGAITTGPDMMYPLPKAAKAIFPEVTHAAVVSFEQPVLFSVGEKIVSRNTITTTADFFDLFSFEFIAGNPSAIKNPDGIILTESTAKALFNHNNVIGQAIKIDNDRSAYVQAVIKDLPRNSTLQFDVLIPFNPASEQVIRDEQEWVNCSNRVFFKTKEGANIPALEKKILDLIKEKTGAENPTTRGSIRLHPMKKWRLYEEFQDGQNTGGRIQYVSLFSWIALVLLIIACVNFMNLSTARSEKRAKEVGIRKTLGSGRRQLLGQFLSESLVISGIAFVFSLILVIAILPAFSTLLNQEIQFPYREPKLWLFLLALIAITGLVAGSYPAFYLSSLNPVKILKGSFLPGKKAMLPRKILVTGQFIVSILLIAAVLVIFQQLQHVKNRDLGYDPNNLIMLNSSRDTDNNFAAFKNDLLQTGMVSAVNRTSSPVTNIYGFTSGIRWTGAPENNDLVIGFIFSDEDFTQTMNAKMLEGRGFQTNDTNSVIFNKEAIRLMGLKHPLGTEITWAGRTRTIIGVLDNMVMTSPYAAPDPLMVGYENRGSRQTNIRLTANADLRKALPAIESIYKKYSIAYPFEYRFVDEVFQEKFLNEQLIGKLAVIFAGLAIFICCLGLFGLVSFSIERRNKEIGIRKVLGASVQQLLILLSKEFLILVGIAFLIAIPAAWWGMNEWLKNFTYRITIHPILFVGVGLITLMIALITVSLNASKAALSAPVKSLRKE